MPDTAHGVMPPRRLGSDGPVVGAVGLGCMGMSWAYSAGERNDDASALVIQRALDLGVTLIDTADMYGPFTNEELVGRALGGRRHEAVLATKGGLVVHDAARYDIRRDGRPEHIAAAIDASLRRLRTDAVDLYQLHRVDEAVPLEETWGAMAELVAAGKAKAIGLSEVTADELARAHALHPVAAVQSELSLWTRDPLREVVPWCSRHGATFLAYAPLGRGFLTGTVASAGLTADDFRSANPRFAPSAVEANQSILERVTEVAARHGSTPAQVALAWVLAQGEYVVPIPGTKKLRWLEENAAAASLELTGADLGELDAVPAAVGERY